MTAQRSTKEEHSYGKITKADVGKGCPFCAINDGHAQFICETKNLKLIRNRQPYSLWDDQGVSDHLMILPKQHISSVGELSPEASAELTKLIGEYEQQGYCFYGRAVKSKMRSEPHQHTHLIKLDGKKRNFLLMVRKPWYFRISK